MLANKKTIACKYCHYQDQIGICKICFQVIQYKKDPINPVYKHLKIHTDKIIELKQTDRDKNRQILNQSQLILDQYTQGIQKRAVNSYQSINRVNMIHNDSSSDSSYFSDSDHDDKVALQNNLENRTNKFPFQLWSYAIYDEKQQIATCKFCKEAFYIANNSSKSLRIHLQTTHSINLSNADKICQSKQRTNTTQHQTKNKNKKLIQLCFTFEKQRAICRLCNTQINTLNSQNNVHLLTHLKQYHKPSQIHKIQQNSYSHKIAQNKNNTATTRHHKVSSKKQKKISENMTQDYFYIDSLKRVAICQLCQCLFSTKNGLQKFIYHIQTTHKLSITQNYNFRHKFINIMDVFCLDQKSKTNIPIGMHNTDKLKSIKNNQSLGLPIKKHKGLNSQVVSNNKKLGFSNNKIYSKYCQTFRITSDILKIDQLLAYTLGGSKEDYIDCLSTIKRTLNFKIFSYHSQQIIQLYLFIKQINNEPKTIAKKQISCWQFFYLTRLHSIVYIIGNTKQCHPIILGFALIPIQTGQCYKNIFNLFYKHICFIPNQIFVCGSTRLKNSIQQITKKVIEQKNIEQLLCKKLLVIRINQKILELKQTQFLQLHIQQLLNQYCQLEQKTDSKIFIGLLFTKNFYKQIRNLLPDEIQLSKQLQSFFQIIINHWKHTSISHIAVQPQDKFLIQAILNKSQQNQQMYFIKSMVCTQVYIKICLSYSYALLKLKVIQKNQNLFLSAQNQQQKYHIAEINQYYLAWEQTTKKWKCDCALHSLSGIPCPHLILLIIHLDIPISSYIDDCWILQKKNSEEKIENITKSENNKDIDNLISQQLGSIKDFESLFWE